MKQKSKGVNKGLKTSKFIDYQYNKKKRNKIKRNLKNKLFEVINTIVCKILRKFSKKCENCSILNGYNKKYFLDMWQHDDFEFLLYCNCEHYKIIKWYLKFIKFINKRKKNEIIS